MEYVVGRTQGGWVIHCYFEYNYIGNISDLDNNISKIQSLAFFDGYEAENYINTELAC